MKPKAAQSQFDYSCLNFANPTTDEQDEAIESDSDGDVSEIDSVHSRLEDFNEYNSEEPEPSFAFQDINPEDMRILHPNTQCTVADLHAMIYAFSIRHNLSWTTTEDLVRLLNRVIGKKELSTSKHVFKEKIRKFSKCETVKHFVCHKCEYYLGTLDSIKDSNIHFCPICREEVQLNTKYKKNHFISIPIKDHLQTILERNCDNLISDFNQTNSEIHDVHDSSQFRAMRDKMQGVSIITLTFSTDGAVKFKSTKDRSLWPLQFIINEINLENRFKRENVLCSSFAFGATPNMQIFMRPFIEEIQKINAQGGISFKMKNGLTKRAIVIPMIFTGDTIARTHVLNKVQFNGYNGCPYCLHKGTIINRQIRYCRQDNGALRTNNQVRSDMIEAQISKRKINGYHGASALMALEYFDVVWQVGIDKMHNIDIGIVKLIFKLLLSRDYKNEGYNFNIYAQFINALYNNFSYAYTIF